MQRNREKEGAEQGDVVAGIRRQVPVIPTSQLHVFDGATVYAFESIRDTVTGNRELRQKQAGDEESSAKVTFDTLTDAIPAVSSGDYWQLFKQNISYCGSGSWLMAQVAIYAAMTALAVFALIPLMEQSLEYVTQLPEYEDDNLSIEDFPDWPEDAYIAGRNYIMVNAGVNILYNLFFVYVFGIFLNRLSKHWENTSKTDIAKVAAISVLGVIAGIITFAMGRGTLLESFGQPFEWTADTGWRYTIAASTLFTALLSRVWSSNRIIPTMRRHFRPSEDTEAQMELDVQTDRLYPFTKLALAEKDLQSGRDTTNGMIKLPTNASELKLDAQWREKCIVDYSSHILDSSDNLTKIRVLLGNNDLDPLQLYTQWGSGLYERIKQNYPSQRADFLELITNGITHRYTRRALFGACSLADLLPGLSVFIAGISFFAELFGDDWWLPILGGAVGAAIGGIVVAFVFAYTAGLFFEYAFKELRRVLNTISAIIRTGTYGMGNCDAIWMGLRLLLKTVFIIGAVVAPVLLALDVVSNPLEHYLTAAWGGFMEIPFLSCGAVAQQLGQGLGDLPGFLSGAQPYVSHSMIIGAQYGAQGACTITNASTMLYLSRMIIMGLLIPVIFGMVRGLSYMGSCVLEPCIRACGSDTTGETIPLLVDGSSTCCSGLFSRFRDTGVQQGDDQDCCQWAADGLKALTSGWISLA